jgi:hypothetical protein
VEQKPSQLRTATGKEAPGTAQLRSTSFKGISPTGENELLPGIKDIHEFQNTSRQQHGSEHEAAVTSCRFHMVATHAPRVDLFY